MLVALCQAFGLIFFVVFFIVLIWLLIFGGDDA